MGQAKLEIVITHWNEPWSVCGKMFEMMNAQRGMGQSECRVTIVQDGDGGGIDWAVMMKKYAWITQVIHIPHGGISAARNAGIEAADADYIMFCDCDDMLYTCDALRRTMDAIRDDRGRSDILWGEMLIENRDRTGRWFTSPQGWNLVFIHGKCWRLGWLREKGLRFREELQYSEDSFFCGETAMETRAERIRMIPGGATYMWCLRAGSCTSDPENGARNRLHMARHRILMPAVALERKPEEAAAKAARGMFDAYYEMTGGKIPEKEKEQLEELYAMELILPWRAQVEDLDPEEKRKIMAASREGAVRQGGFTEETITWRAWMEKMREKAWR